MLCNSNKLLEDYDEAQDTRQQIHSRYTKCHAYDCKS